MDPQKIGDQAELRVFKNLLEKLSLLYIHIDQDRKTYSSEIFLNNAKRPDFLISFPTLGSIFIDVKARFTTQFRKLEFKSRYPAFTIDYTDFEKLKQTENLTHIPVWIAFIERDQHSKELKEEITYAIPLTRIEKLITDEHREGKWKKVQVPLDCTNKWRNNADINNICETCTEKICEIKD